MIVTILVLHEWCSQLVGNFDHLTLMQEPNPRPTRCLFLCTRHLTLLVTLFSFTTSSTSPKFRSRQCSDIVLPLILEGATCVSPLTTAELRSPPILMSARSALQTATQKRVPTLSVARAVRQGECCPGCLGAAEMSEGGCWVMVPLNAYVLLQIHFDHCLHQPLEPCGHSRNAIMQTR